MPDQRTIDEIKAAGHVDYPYSSQERFSSIVDLYESRDENSPCFTGTLGTLFDENLEADLGATSPEGIEELRTLLVETGSFEYGMGYWVVPKGSHPKNDALNSALKL